MQLPFNFHPDKWTVVCGRSKDCYDGIGNRRLRVLIDMQFEQYTSARSKMTKTLIVSSILDTIREASQVGGFVKQDPKTKMWFVVSDDVAREKIGQLFREKQLKADPSRVQARKERRRERRREKSRLCVINATTRV